MLIVKINEQYRKIQKRKYKSSQTPPPIDCTVTISVNNLPISLHIYFCCSVSCICHLTMRREHISRISNGQNIFNWVNIRNLLNHFSTVGCLGCFQFFVVITASVY